jgi:hypothetical protein
MPELWHARDDENDSQFEDTCRDDAADPEAAYAVKEAFEALRSMEALPPAYRHVLWLRDIQAVLRIDPGVVWDDSGSGPSCPPGAAPRSCGPCLPKGFQKFRRGVFRVADGHVQLVCPEFGHTLLFEIAGTLDDLLLTRNQSKFGHAQEEAMLHDSNDGLAKEINKQPWDPIVNALTQVRFELFSYPATRNIHSEYRG